jgi:hypothetical protein
MHGSVLSPKKKVFDSKTNLLTVEGRLSFKDLLETKAKAKYLPIVFYLILVEQRVSTFVGKGKERK